MSPSERSHSPKREAVCSAEVLALLEAGGCGSDELDAWWEGAPADRMDGYRRSQASARGRGGAALRCEETLRDWKGDAHRPEREAQPGKLPANGLALEVRRDDPVPERRKLESRRGEAEWLERVPPRLRPEAGAAGREPRGARPQSEGARRQSQGIPGNAEGARRRPRGEDRLPRAATLLGRGCPVLLWNPDTTRPEMDDRRAISGGS